MPPTDVGFLNQARQRLAGKHPAAGAVKLIIYQLQSFKKNPDLLQRQVGIFYKEIR